MTDETNVAEAANDTAVADTEAATDASAAQPPETPADSKMSLDDRLSAKFDEMNAEPESAETATGEGEEELAPEGADETDQPTGEEGEQSEVAAIAAPVSWSKEMAEQWATLNPQMQEYVSQRELETQQRLSKQGNELARARPIIDVVSKYQQSFDRHGVTLEQGMESLMKAQAILDQDPLKGIAAIAQTYGIDLPKVFGPAYQNMDPALRQLVENNQRLQAQVLNSQRDQQAQQAAEVRAAEEHSNQQIEEWLAKEDRPYYEQVHGAMVALIQTGQADSLDSAYDMACYANPTIRAELAAAERAAEQARADEAARLKAQQDSAAKARAAKDAKRKAATNGGNRANVASVTTGDFLDEDAMSQRLEAILANA